MKYRVEFGFAENFISVNEYQTIDGLEAVEGESAEEAARIGGTVDLGHAAYFFVKLFPAKGDSHPPPFLH